MYKKFFFPLLFIATNTSMAQVQPLAPFQTGERVCFVGNSITEQGYYESYVWLYYMLHFPGRRITVYNCGIGGDRAQNILARLHNDVLVKKPTTICLTFGMNDTGYSEFLTANADSTAKERVRASHRYFDTITQKLNAYPAAKKILITSPLYDETMKNPRNYFPKKSIAMDAIADVLFIQGDFREDEVLQKLINLVPERGLDLLLSDMAPNMSGTAAVDVPRAMYLAELAFDFGSKMLKPGGMLLMKIFHGVGFDELVKLARMQFDRVVIRKPLASRSRSRETYLLAKGYNL